MRDRILDRRGVSLVELVLGMLLLSVGLLALAGGGGWMLRTVDVTRVDAERSASVQSALEEIRATPFADVGPGQTEHGGYEATWSVVEESPNGKRLEIIVVGRGRTPGTFVARPSIGQGVTDTLEYQVHRP